MERPTATPDPAGLVRRSAYWHDRDAKHAFIAFLRQIHGLDLTAWDESGAWDERYEPHTLFDGPQPVASLCVYSMPAVILGQHCRVAQISGVGTLPAWRRLGLNRRLHESVLPQVLQTHRFVFLFADDEALPFYRACGFVPMANAVQRLVLPTAGPACRPTRRLNMALAADRQRLEELARNSAPLSNRVAIRAPKLVLFHALYGRRDEVHELPELGAIVLMRRNAERTVVHDILARELPPLEAWLPYLRPGQGREIEFRLAIDRLAPPPLQLQARQDDHLHVMGAPEGLAPPWLMPATAYA